MRPACAAFLVLVAGCRGGGEESARAPTADRIRLIGEATPPVRSGLVDFRPFVRAPADTGGRCSEYGYATGRGLAGITWRQEWPAGGFWLIHITLDSSSSPRLYYEDRFERDQRTI